MGMIIRWIRRELNVLNLNTIICDIVTYDAIL